MTPDSAWAGYQRLIINGRTSWVIDAHGYGKRFIVRADEILNAFLELEAAILTEEGQKPLSYHPSSFRAIHRKGFPLYFLK